MAYRLAFLALHKNQYGPAKNEALSRKNSNKTTLLQQHNVGPFDYECEHDTKYLLVSLAPSKKQGFAVSANPFINAILAAMASGRVILTYHKETSALFSCERNDWQCAFLPLSPCVITQDDLGNGYHINKDDFKTLLQNGTLGSLVDNSKVVIADELLMLTEPTPHIRQKFIEIIRKLVRNGRVVNPVNSLNEPWDLSTNELGEVYNIITTEPWFLSSVAWAYSLRPNLRLKNQIDRLLSKALPEDFDASRSIGLAVRQSDKCRRESQCMSFDDYMQLVQDFATKRILARKKESTNGALEGMSYDTIILTSEDANIMKSRFEYTNRSEFPFRFVANDEDVVQGGWGGKVSGEYTADDVLVSSFTSVKLQLAAESSIVNGCSSFHRQIMWNLREMGFAKTRQWYTETLNQNENPKWRMKCGMGISQF